ADNGIGIAADQFDRAFQPFQHVHNEDYVQGTGIGLAICQKAIQRHGGRIWIESTPGAGSHFRFTLD
ncbi:MAG: histidine kinase, partial [Planctomycetales bacterium]|nr:histidine kinase [Planctomycetales bacterium]